MNKCLRETCDWKYRCQGCPKDPAVSLRQQLEEAQGHARLIQARSVNMADELETTIQALSQAQAALGEEHTARMATERALEYVLRLIDGQEECLSECPLQLTSSPCRNWQKPCVEALKEWALAQEEKEGKRDE